jgi:putative ABC transport system permease protein
VRYRDRALYGVLIQGSTPEITRIGDIDLVEGRWYNDFENRTARNVCIIGAEVADNLFPSERPIGKQIRVGGHRFEIVGVLARQGKFLGLFSFDEQIQLPFNTFEKLFGGRRSVTIQVKAASEENLNLAEDEITGILRAARGVDAMDESDFAINRQEAFREALGAIKGTIYAIGIFLTALALVVGGIGVMNIMFVTVKERTKEIGIRKAVGATRRTILMQFLIEAVIVCVIAGLIGVVISAGVAMIINTFFTAYLSIATVVLAFSICVGIGVFFGLVPAWNAARANPIDALRYE